MNTTARPGELVGRIEALAEPIRIRLLRVLERHELGVGDLCEILQSPQSTVSRHLKQLADQGWIGSRRQATSHLYRMDPKALDATARQLWKVVRDESGRWATARQDQLRLSSRLEERRARSRSFFARAAGRWDALRQQLYGGAFAHAALLELLPPEWIVADLGCGTGELTAELAQHVRGVIGIDQSEAMLAAARQRTARFRNVELREGELEALPLADGSCDAALLVLVLTYTAEPEVAVAEAVRVLRPGGRLVLVDLLSHDREEFRRELGQQWAGFEPVDVESMLTGSGLTRVRTRPLPPAAEAKGPALLIASGARPDAGHPAT